MACDGTPVDDGRTEAQLAAIAEMGDVAARLGIEIWLGGGWSMEFYLGRVTRRHEDIDWFTLGTDAQRLTDTLLSLGFVRSGTAHPAQQTDLVRGPIDHGIAWIRRRDDGTPVVAGGPFAGEPWPADLLDGPTLPLEGVTARIISPHALVTIKEMTPVWRPDLPRREKDAQDIAAIGRRFEGNGD